MSPKGVKTDKKQKHQTTYWKGYSKKIPHIREERAVNEDYYCLSKQLKATLAVICVLNQGM